MSEQFSRAPQEDSSSDRLSVVRVWALVLLAVLAGGAVFLRGRRLVDNIIPVSADSVAPTELQRDE
ncbi:MAG: hypothetical protein AAGB19_04810 [Cyanobacteria bacterium P01_F01_bin.3]